jgi:hypothetical protein
MQLGAVDCVKAVFDACARSTADVRAMLQSVSPTKIILVSYLEVSECLHVVPAVVEWMQRLAYYRGAT